MKTRTLLLLSVATALAILLAGGILLVQLSSEADTVAPTSLGVPARVGDATVTVFGAAASGELYDVDVELGGVDDDDGLDGFRLVTGDERLAPLSAPADGRCRGLTLEPQRCRLSFDISSVESSSRVLVMRRGDEQLNWQLGSA